MREFIYFRVLFPGGDSSDEYLYVAKLFYIWSLKVKRKGIFLRNIIFLLQEFDEMKRSFPLWGTCLGFETLFMLTKASSNVLEPCKGYDYATELTFMPGI